MSGEKNMYDIVIIGSGVAGLTAGIYAGRANKSVLIIEDNNLGGTTATLKDIKNFPSYDSVDGDFLVSKMQMQCINLGVHFQFENIVSIDFAKSIIHLSSGNQIEYKSLIIASGSTNKKLNVQGEDYFKFRGVSYCAVCDGNLYKNKKLIVFTDGNTASHDIEYLSNLTNNIIVFDISNKYKNDNLQVIHNVKPIEISGDENVKSVKVNISGSSKDFECDGIFVDLGKCTDVHLYQDFLDIIDNQICSDENMHTNINNVFVAGDIRKKSLKQIITACSDGAIAGSEAIKYLNNIK